MRGYQQVIRLHVDRQVIRTTADHPFYVPYQGWINAGDLPGAKSDGEQQVVYHLNLGEPAMPDQPRPNFPIVGFVAGTPLLTPDGHKRIEDIKPGDIVQSGPDGEQPDDDQGDEHAGGEPHWWERN